MRWKEALVGLALTVATTAGCKQQVFLAECDRDQYLNQVNLPDLEGNPNAAVVPSCEDVGKPADILDAERKPRYLTLNEALAMALENGQTGVQSPLFPGTVDDNLSSFQGQGITLADSIRVLALEPAAVATNIEASLSKFDARWTTSMNWGKTDEPTGGNFIQSFQNGDTATLQSSLLKPLPTGGVAGITFSTAYTLLAAPPAGVANPAYRPRLQFQFEQPLLQGFGVEINQLRTNHPGSILTPFNNSSRVEGILITRLRFDEQRADFQRALNYMLVNVEIAYWNLYDSYWTLYSREQALRQAYEAWRINRDRLEAGRISRQDLAETRQQYELFRGQRITALNDVLERERQMRTLMGLPIEDGTRLIPVDVPTLEFYLPDWSTSLTEALTNRPELVLAREDLKFRQLDVINQKNLLMPDLRFTSTYALAGFGTRLDGPVSDPSSPDANALRSLASDKFYDWGLGLRLDVPLGFRDAHSAVRQARLRLAQSYLSLREEEKKATSFLAMQYRNLSSAYELIRAERAQREAATVSLESRLKEYLAGKIILDVLLKSQEDWADALRGEYDAITQYNTALARFEFAKGTIAQHDNVLISEGSLPHCAQVRAVEHEKQRERAIVLRERARPVLHTPCNYAKGSVGLPVLPADQAASIPALYQGMASSKDAKPSADVDLPAPEKASAEEAHQPTAWALPQDMPKETSRKEVSAGEDTTTTIPTPQPTAWQEKSAREDTTPAVPNSHPPAWGSLTADAPSEGLEQLPTLKAGPAGEDLRLTGSETYQRLPPAAPPSRGFASTPESSSSKAKLLWGPE
ncbi:MAG: TolC family protein [Planctomycetes bacterium]|nr:TolC family protein [Planctomycetota bacterium]